MTDAAGAGTADSVDQGHERALSRYERMVRSVQAEARVPALQVALHRADRPLWTFEVGDSGTDRALDAATQFRLGSITKTFTDVLVMQCRDDGLLGLDDAIGSHVELPNFGDLTVRRLMSHTSGIQREPFGDVWDTLEASDGQEFLDDLRRAEAVLPPGRRFHYSNLGLGLLGHLVGRLRGGTWAEVLADRILTPLGMGSITVRPTGSAAVGYLVDAYSDHARPEPNIDFAGIAPAGQLWGSAADLARWAGFLADPESVDPEGHVLAASTVDEMRWPVTVSDEALWSGGFGLGLILVPQGDRVVHVGHDGAMPGFLAGAYGRRGKGSPRGLGVAVMGSSGTAAGILALPHSLLAAAVEHDPVDITPWRVGEPVPDALRSVLGPWWSEGFPYVFTWSDGALRARGADDPAGRPPAVFAPEGSDGDTLRAVSGREVGELLRLHRDGSGTVTSMHWATYLFARTQQTFDKRSPS